MKCKRQNFALRRENVIKMIYRKIFVFIHISLTKEIDLTNVGPISSLSAIKNAGIAYWGIRI